jgi:hypothetical protein
MKTLVWLLVQMDFTKNLILFVFLVFTDALYVYQLPSVRLAKRILLKTQLMYVFQILSLFVLVLPTLILRHARIVTLHALLVMGQVNSSAQFVKILISFRKLIQDYLPSVQILVLMVHFKQLLEHVVCVMLPV